MLELCCQELDLHYVITGLQYFISFAVPCVVVILIIRGHTELNVLRETSSSQHQGSHYYGSGIRPDKDDTKFAILDRIIAFGLFVMMATREAIKEKVLHASAPHAPYVSTAKGP